MDIANEGFEQSTSCPFYSSVFLDEVVPEVTKCRNASFAIIENKEPLAIVPFFLGRKWGMNYGRMSPLYCSGPTFCGEFSLTKKVKIAQFAREVIKTKMKEGKMHWVQFRQSVFSQPPFIGGLDLGHMVIDFGAFSYSLVIDVRDLEVVLATMESQSRGAIRRASNEGISVERKLVADEGDAERISELYDQAYRSKGYSTKKEQVFSFWKSMARLRNALLFVARNKKGAAVSYAVVHPWDRFAYYSVGGTVRNAEFATGAANLLQWEIMQFLRAQNIQWYELSHSNLLSPNEGKRTVAEFKRSLGAQEYPYLRGFLYRGHFLDKMNLNPRW